MPTAQFWSNTSWIFYNINTKLQGYWYFLDSHINFFQSKINIILAGNQIQRILCGKIYPSVWKSWGFATLMCSHTMSVPPSFLLCSPSNVARANQSSPKLKAEIHILPYLLAFLSSATPVLIQLFFPSWTPPLQERSHTANARHNSGQVAWYLQVFGHLHHPELTFLSKNDANLTESFLQ